MRRTLLAAGAFVLGLGCQSDPGEGTIPVLGAADTQASLGFERPPDDRASRLLPPEIVRGEHHRVLESVGSDGFLYLWQVESDFGDFEVRGEALLRTRIAEIEALAMLDEIGRSEAFAAALLAAARNPVVAGWNLLTHPVDSLLGLPKNALAEVRRIASLATGERGEFEDRAIREVLGFEDRKRALAAGLGVDPYSSNARLQREMNRTAWALWAGGFAFELVPFRRVGEGAGTRPWIPAASHLAERLANQSPEDLRRMNRIELAVMGVEAELADRFLGHRWFSPRHHTIIVGSLADLEAVEGRRAFFEASLTAATEQDALLYQRTAELLAAVHRRVEPIDRIAAGGRVVRAYLESGTRITPVEVDHLIWTRPVLELVELGAAVDDAPRREIWLSGTASPRAREEIQRRGFGLLENMDPVFVSSSEAME